MSYRRGYYKKDGTFVQGHYVRSRIHLKQTNNKNKSGCLGAFVLILISCLALLKI